MSLICPIKEVILNIINSFLGGKGKKRLLFAIISIIVFTVFGIETFLASKANAATGVRHVINFQGKVVNSNGTNVADGLYRFQFKIYTVSSGGSPVWTEDWDSGNKVQVTGGIFQVQLGTITTLPGSIDFNTDNIYLGVTFHTDGEMTPRVQFATVPQAFNAEKVNGLTVVNTSGNPFGSTTTFRIADGKTVSINNGLTFAGTDSTSFTFPSTGGNIVTEDFAQTLTNKTIGSTGLTFSGATTDVTTGSNEDFTFTPNGSGDLVITSDYNSGVSIGSASNTPAPLSVTGGIGNNAALIVNQLNNGNLFAASAAGTTKFEITSTGAITSQAYTNTGGIVYTTSTGLLSQTAGGVNGNCLTYTGGLPAWGPCGSGGDGLWRTNLGSISPVNDSFDLLVGSIATTSAKFAILGVNNARGLQTASISGNLVLDAAGSIQTTKNQTLTIGGDTSGELILKSNNVVVLRTPGTSNIFVGANAGVVGLSGTNNVVLGGTAGNTLAAGSRNTFLGDGAGQSNNGSDNTFVGRITGSATGTGTNNAFFGTSTGTNNAGGSYNTFIGYAAGNVNTEGLYNTIVGTQADFVGNSLTNANAFGTQAIVAASNSLVLGGTGTYAVNVGIGTTTPLSAFNVVGGNNGGRAAVIINQTGASSNDILAASSAGTTKFVLKNDGTASTSGSFVIDGSGALQSTRNQTLNIGGNTTGNVVFAPNGNVQLINNNAASKPPLAITGSWFSGGDSTTTKPQLLIEPAGTSSTNWSTNGTGLGINAPSGFTGHLFDLQIAGTSYLRAFPDATYGFALFQNQGGLGIGSNWDMQFWTRNGSNINIRPDGAFQVMQMTDEGDTVWLNISDATGNVGLGTTSQISELHVTRPLSYGANGKALVIFDQIENQDIFTASSSGTPRFTITNAGGVKLGTNEGNSAECLKSGGAGAAASWAACGSGGSGSNWVLSTANGTLSPINNTLDLLIGNTATTTAKFAVLGINGNAVPTASVSAQNAAAQALVLGGDGTIQSVRNNSLLLGGSTTGNIILSPLNNTGRGTVGIGGAPVGGYYGAFMINGDFGGKALSIFNVTSSTADIFAASSSGTTRFVLKNDGTASTSASFVIDGSGSLQATRNQNLTLGGNTTGNIILNPINGAGRVGINNFSPLEALDVVGNATLSGNLVFNSSASLQTTKNLTLNLGGGTTGNIILSPLNNTGRGTVGIGGAPAGGYYGAFMINGDFGGKALSIFNVTSSTADIFAASSSGTTKFVLKNDGTASTSGSFVIDGSGALQSTRNQTLNIGGNTTGNVVFAPNGAVLFTNAGVASKPPVSLTGNWFTGGTSTTTKPQLLLEPAGTPSTNWATAGTGFGMNAASGFAGNYLDFQLNGDGSNSRVQIYPDGSNGVGIDLSTSASINAGFGLTLTTGNTSPITLSPHNGDVIFVDGGTSTTSLTADMAAGAATLTSGTSFTLASGGNSDISLNLNGTGNLNLGGDFNSQVLIGATGATTEFGLFLNNGIGSNASFAINNPNSGDLFTASSSGTTRFSLTNAGGIRLGASEGNALECLKSGGAGVAASWGTCGSSGGGSNWLLSSNIGTLSPINNTLDLLWGSSAISTQSAKFSVLGIAGTNTPVASVSATSGSNATKGLYISGDGSLQSVRRNTLTIGGNTTGDIVFSPGGSTTSLSLSSSGALGVNGTYGVSGQCLITSGSSAAPNWAGCNSGSNSNWWTLQSAQGTLYPINTTLDMLWGGTSSSSATFRLTGNATLAGTTSVASIAANTSFAGFVIDQRGAGDFLTASASGLTKFTITKEGGITASSGLVINKQGSVDIVKTSSGNNQLDSDFQRTANSTNATLTNLDNSGGEISLSSGAVSGDGTITTSSQPAAPGALGAGASTILRPDGKYLVIRGGATTLYIFDSLLNAFTTSPQVLNNAAGAGSLALPRSDGRYLVIHGGGATTNSIVDPTGNMAVGASVASNANGAGTNAFRRQNGRYIVINGGAGTTQLWDPSAAATAWTAGPAAASGTWGAGSLILARPDGTALIINGGATATTNLYDPFNGTGSIGSMTAGPVLPTNCEINGAGSVALQKADGRYIILSKAGVSVEYDPVTNTMGSCQAVGPAAALADGAHAIRLQDKRFMIFRGSGTTNAYLYNPATNTYSTHATSTSTQGAGAHSFQRHDGKWVLMVGGATTTNLIDTQLVMTGSYVSEDITTSALNPSSTLHYIIGAEANFTGTTSATTDIPQTGLEISVQTAGSQGGLSSATSVPIRRSGELIRSSDGNSWLRVSVNFTRPIPQRIYDERKTYTGNGTTVYIRDYQSPTLYEFTIDNSTVLAKTGWDFLNSQSDEDPTEASASALTRVMPMNDRLFLPWGNVPGQTAVGATGLYMGKPGPHTPLQLPTGEGTLVLQRPGGMFAVIATGSANTSFQYDSASQTFTPLTGAGNGPTAGTGAGAAALKLPNGKFLIVLGNNSAVTNIYDPLAASGSQFVAGPNLSGNAGLGAQFLPNTDGTYTIMHGNALTTTTLFNPFTDLTKPPATVLPAGPTTTTAVNCGAWAIPLQGFNAGLFRVFPGVGIGVTGISTTMNYDARAKIFSAGTNLTTAHGCGSMAFQRQDGYWVSLTAGGGTNGMPQATTNIHNPYFNAAAAAQSTLAGPALTASVGRGSTVIPRPDGTFLIIHGQQGQAPTSTTTVYIPWGSTYGVGAPIGYTSAGPAMNDITGAGATVFQRQDGKWVIINGSHVGVSTVNIYDAGWYPDGQYLSGQMYAPQLTPDSVITWKKSPDDYIGFEVRTAPTREALLTKEYNSISRSGDIIGATAGDKWIQVQINFSRQFNGFADGTRGDIWFSGGARPYLNFPTPTLFEYKITNDTDLMILRSNGSNAFRVSENGSVFAGAQGGFFTGGADLAENYASKETLVAGEVVQIDAAAGNHHVKRTNNQYQSGMLGVVSTEPGFVAGAYTEDSSPIALVGRVPVKISTENGPIREGDALTSASIPGYAMKATVGGRVLGRALESFNEANAEPCPTVGMGAVGSTKCGTVMVFVNLIDYNGQSIEVAMTESGFSFDENELPLIAGLNFEKGSENYNQQVVLGFLKTQKDNGQGIFTDHVSATQDVISPKIITDLLVAKKIKAESIEGLEILTNNIEQLSNRVASGSAITNFADRLDKLQSEHLGMTEQMASLSASLEKMKAINLLSFVAKSTESSDLVMVNNFASYGTTTLSQVSVMDTLSVGGSMTLGASSIDTLGENLELQPLRQGGVSFLGGLITFNVDGQVTFGQNVTFEKDVTVKGVLSATSVSSTELLLGNSKVKVFEDGSVESTGAAGLITLKKNTREIRIVNPLVKETSLIFITPKTRTKQPLYLVEQVEADINNDMKASFTVGVDTDLDADVKFNYLIVN